MKPNIKCKNSILAFCSLTTRCKCFNKNTKNLEKEVIMRIFALFSFFLNVAYS